MIRLYSPLCSFSQSLTAYTRRGNQRPPLTLTPNTPVSSFNVSNITAYPQHDLTHVTLTHPSSLTLHQL